MVLWLTGYTGLSISFFSNNYFNFSVASVYASKILSKVKALKEGLGKHHGLV